MTANKSRKKSEESVKTDWEGIGEDSSLLEKRSEVAPNRKSLASEVATYAPRECAK